MARWIEIRLQVGLVLRPRPRTSAAHQTRASRPWWGGVAAIGHLDVGSVVGVSTRCRGYRPSRHPRQLNNRAPGAGPILDSMKISLDLPDEVVAQLADAGQDLSRAALEALAIDAYRMDRISGRQLAQLLNISSRYELDGFLKRHGVPLEYNLDDFEREGQTSARLREKRQAELGHPPR